MNKTAKV